MNIIFLDIDGVLNSDHFPPLDNAKSKVGEMAFWAVDPIAVKRLNRLTQETKSKIVISSSWCTSLEFSVLRALLHKEGVIAPIISKTPKLHKKRGLEIESWLIHNAHHFNVRGFIILDDDADMEPYMDRLIQTKWGDGLLDSHVDRAIALLKVTHQQSKQDYVPLGS
jgi:hypothetical protein